MKQFTTPALVVPGGDHGRGHNNEQPFFTTPEAAAYLRASQSYLNKLRVYGGGPTFLRFGKRKVLYRKSDLDLWATKHRFGSTSEYQPSQNQSECISNSRK
jgi:excisionase family DNA binding protein